MNCLSVSDHFEGLALKGLMQLSSAENTNSCNMTIALLKLKKNSTTKIVVCRKTQLNLRIFLVNTFSWYAKKLNISSQAS